MKYCYITFRSVTFAQRGERLMADAGIRCWLRRTPKWMESQGCGYSLRIRGEDVQSALWLLRDRGIPMRKVYAENGEGALEEITV